MSSAPQVKDIFVIPSTYGFLGWCAIFALYELRLAPWDPTTGPMYLLFVAQALAFALSILLHLPQAVVLRRRFETHDLDASLLQVLVFHALGFAGIAIYVRHFGENFGGMAGFVATFFSDSLAIRALAAEQTSFGVQVSYLGWIALTITPFALKRRRGFAVTLLVLLALLQFAVNLMFIDRTRPIWLLFMVSMAFLLANIRSISSGAIVRGLMAAPVAVGGVFVAMGLFIGKIGDDGSTHEALLNLYHYLTAGFSYLNHVLLVESVDTFSTARTLAPLHNVLAALGLGEPAPSTVLEFYEVPLPTNVGTALEPFYRDGGWSYAVVGCLVLSLGVDHVALRAARLGAAMSIHLWAALCFVSATAFFVQKLGNLSMWIFLALAIVSALLHLTSRSPGQPGNSRVAPP